METGFFTHDEEHFSSSFYSHGNGLEDSEGSLFGGIIDVELDYPGSQFDPLPALWDPAENDNGTLSQEGDSITSPIDCKEDFQQMLTDWHEHLSCLQVPEPSKMLPILRTDSIAINSRLPTDIPDILFTNSVGNNLSAPSMDDLFPLEIQMEEVDITTEDKVVRKTTLAEVQFSFSIEEPKEEKLPEPELTKILPKPKQPLIKCEEGEEDCVDVETVGEQIPVLEAGDLTSLLEQFEASEVVNGNIDKLPSVLESHLYAMATQQLLVSPTSPSHVNANFPSNQSIRESLPQEVIDRIKASRRKKVIPVIPAIPTKKSGRAATRMQDAGFALSRNKLLKLVTVGSTGESVQLDHDYCTSVDNNLTTYYPSDGSSELSSQSSTPELAYSRFPDYYVSLTQQKQAESKPFKETWTEKNSKKDSGLESGDVSDASEETQVVNANENNTKGKVVLKSVAGMKSVNLVTENGLVIGSAAMKDRKEMTMVSVLKKCNLNNLPVQNSVVSLSTSVSTSTLTSSISTSTSTDNDITNPVEIAEPVKKRKLNLEEYRVRREERERKRSQENSRSNSPNICSSEIQPDSTTSTQDSCATQKPVMHSVEVQTQTNDFLEVELKRSKDQTKNERDHNRDKRSDARRRSYRARHVSSSSSSSSGESSRHRSHRKRRDSRSDRHYKNATSRMWSRSRSRSSTRSSHTNCSSCSSHSRSRSRSRDSRRVGKRHNRSPRHSYNNKPVNRRDNRRWQRPRSPSRTVRTQEWDGAEKLRQVEERRVIYVGRIDEGTTKAHLRARFEVFGPIVDISVHFRERGDNYGFVTFAYKVDAYEAVEHGNDDPSLPHYDLCFGGRRAFCKQRYADLDGATNGSSQYSPYQVQRTNDSFDLLLREAQAKLRKRSSV